MAAFFALEGGKLFSVDANANEKSDKKAALGKGTSILVQFIKDRLVKDTSAGDDKVETLKHWMEKVLTLLSLEDLGFACFLDKVKEIIESNEDRRLPKLPKSTRDFAKEQMAVREKAFSIIQDVFKRHGATALDTPVFELRDTLMGKYGEESKLIYDLADQVKLSHRKLLDGMLEICGVSPENFRSVCSSIDKLDKQSFEQVKKEIVEEKGLSPETADRIGSFVKERGQPMELLSKLRQEGSELLSNESSKEALEDLSIMFEALERSNCINRVVFDLSLARGLDYYTGVIFEAVCKGAEVGTIGAGGRYDNLIGMLGTQHVPAAGVSLGITIMEEVQKQQKQVVRATETQVLVSIVAEDKLAEAAGLVSELWGAKIKAEYLVSKRWEKHLKRATKSGIPWMVKVGERELDGGVVTLKKMVKGSEKEYRGVPKESFVDQLLKLLTS
ncbi:unnamed protein product [Thlaspi arvense]|uniref:histidine--tRNA ligase n=1 Tax=Thlaspi arvense TaxID=13288 RepID=A0AAU9SEP1_THLAR|nr:unnamed protein product [Thlaspi arvense]